jgi:hypothetical protein
MADPDPNNPNLFQRAKQAQSKALREQVARSAEAVAETEQEVARVHRTWLSRVVHWRKRPGSMPTGLSR